MNNNILALVLFVGFGYTCVAQTNKNNDTLHWRAARPLSYEDFKGKPKKNTDISGESFCNLISNYEKPNPLKKTKYKAVAVFDRNKSWIGTDFKNANELLYFQVLFNIYEVHARLLKKELSETKFGLNPEATFRAAYNKIDATLTEECNTMRDETNNGKDGNALKKWDAKVKEELEELAAYK